MAVSFSTNFILKKMMRLDAKSEAQNHRYRARGVCVAAPNKTEQIPNSVVGGVGQSPQIPEPELIMSTGVAARQQLQLPSALGQHNRLSR